MRNVILFLAFFCLFGASSAQAKSISLDDFATLPVVHEGRIKPLDSFARIYLISFARKDSLQDMTAVSWLAELLFDQERAYQRPVFNVPNPDVLYAVGLEYRQGHIYSFAELSTALSDNLDILEKLSQMPPSSLSMAQRQLMALFEAVSDYYEISLSLPSAEEHNIFNVPSEVLRIVPSQWGKDKGNWFSPVAIGDVGSGSPQTLDYIKIWEAMGLSYRQDDSELWTQSVRAAQTQIHKITGQSIRFDALETEYIYNRLDLFHASLLLYVAAFVLLMASVLGKTKAVRKGALICLAAGGLLHAAGLVMRVYIMARPPVGTLYESIIFVGLIAVIFALILERRNRDGLGILIGSVLGVVLQFIAMRYAADGNSMGMLSAVLNTNFWLATHVVMITIGYGCCLVTGLIAHYYLVLKVFRSQEKDKLSDLARNMLGAGLVALFFCMLGTILGGIWADQSWGRFWGWDPKENGAMLICLWLITFLHGRIAGIVKADSFAMGMAFLTVVVALAWFGVNLLSVGLHSYGFTENIAMNLMLFIGGEGVFVVVMAILLRRQVSTVTD